MAKLLLDKEYRKQALKAAEELGYDTYCLNRIKKAKSDSEIQRIMRTERERHFED